MNRTTREILNENIVEDFKLYKKLHQDFIVLIKSLNENYNNKMSFDNFYIKILNYFEGVDENKELTREQYIKRLFNAILKVTYDEIENIETIEKFKELMKKEGIKV